MRSSTDRQAQMLALSEAQRLREERRAYVLKRIPGLIADGLHDTAIARQLRCSAALVGRERKRLGAASVKYERWPL